MKRVLYREWVPAGLLTKAIVGAVIASLVLLLLILGVVLYPLTTDGLVGVGVSVATLIAILLLYLNFRGITIQLSSEGLNVSYGLLNHKHITLDNIKSCKVGTASFRRFGGIGVRYGLDGSWAYTTSFGNAVEIVPQKGRTFVFSSNHPEQICQIIETATQGRA
jgi:hypothetical protein